MSRRQTEEGDGRGAVEERAAGLGVLCREAQADGVPCAEIRSDCLDCERAVPAATGAWLAREVPGVAPAV